MQNKSAIELKCSNNIELNNKLALECSYLINEIKRKNSTILLPLYITRKKVFLKNKLLSDKKCHFNLKSNFQKLISKKIQNKRYHRNLSEYNIFQKKTEIDKTNKGISLNLLYNLPKIKPKNKNCLNKNIYSRNSISYSSKSQNNDMIVGSDENGVSSAKKSNNFLGIENFMKEKFYSDTENKLKSKIKTKYFRNDEIIKQKIIFLKKFGIFWRSFIQYCAPIIKLKKYQLDYKYKFGKNNNDKNNNNEIININNYKNESIDNYKQLSLPKID